MWTGRALTLILTKTQDCNKVNGSFFVKTTFKIIVLLALFPLWSLATEDLSREPFGVEIQGLYISQDNDGETLTLLPMFDFAFLFYKEFSLQAQFGATLLKDFPEHRFWATVYRLVPTYTPESQDFSIEVPFGVQFWEGRGAKADIGGRFIHPISMSWVDEVILGGGWISEDDPAYYFAIGLRKWFGR